MTAWVTTWAVGGATLMVFVGLLLVIWTKRGGDHRSRFERGLMSMMVVLVVFGGFSFLRLEATVRQNRRLGEAVCHTDEDFRVLLSNTIVLEVNRLIERRTDLIDEIAEAEAGTLPGLSVFSPEEIEELLAEARIEVQRYDFAVDARLREIDAIREFVSKVECPGPPPPDTVTVAPVPSLPPTHTTEEP